MLQVFAANIEGWWSNLDGQVQAALVGAASTLVVGLFGFLFLGLQARHAVEQNRRNEALKLKLEIYRDIIETCVSSRDADIELGAFLSRFEMELSSARSAAALGIKFPVPKARFPMLQDLQQQSVFRAITVMEIVERWQILDERILIFQDAINAATHDLRAHFAELDPLFMRLAPVEKPGSTEVFPWALPPEAQEAELRKHIGAIQQALSTLGCYVADFQAEMQSLLLREMFRTKVQTRKPIDPKAKVIRLKDFKALRQYFEEETPWGKANADIIAEARSQFAPKRKGLKALWGQIEVWIKKLSGIFRGKA